MGTLTISLVVPQVLHALLLLPILVALGAASSLQFRYLAVRCSSQASLYKAEVMHAKVLEATHVLAGCAFVCSTIASVAFGHDFASVLADVMAGLLASGMATIVNDKFDAWANPASRELGRDGKPVMIFAAMLRRLASAHPARTLPTEMVSREVVLEGTKLLLLPPPGPRRSIVAKPSVTKVGPPSPGSADQACTEAILLDGSSCLQDEMQDKTLSTSMLTPRRGRSPDTSGARHTDNEPTSVQDCCLPAPASKRELTQPTLESKQNAVRPTPGFGDNSGWKTSRSERLKRDLLDARMFQVNVAEMASAFGGGQTV